MKKPTLILLILSSLQFAVAQEKEEQKQQEQKVIKEENGPVVLKSYQNVTVETKKEDAKKEKKEEKEEEIPFGVPFTLSSSECFFNEMSFSILELKKRHSKRYFSKGMTPENFFDYMYEEHNKTPEQLIKEKIPITHRKSSEHSLKLSIPPLKANRYFIVQKNSRILPREVLIDFFLLMHKENKISLDYNKPMEWMKFLVEINKELRSNQCPLPIYYYPTIEELYNYKNALKVFKDIKSLDSKDLARLKDLTIKAFPILNCNSREIECPNRKKNVSNNDTDEKILRFAKWVKNKTGVLLTNDDTWEFGEDGPNGNGIGRYPDFENIYNFYNENLKGRFNQEGNKLNSSNEKIVEILIEELENKKKELESKNEIPANFYYLNSLINLTSDFSTYPKSFETSYTRSITLDFGLVSYWFDSFDNPRGTPFIGANISLAPVNKEVPLALSRLTCWQRLAVHTGITIVSIEEENRREDFFNKVSWMLGGSYKIGTQATRINAGGIFYNKIDAVNGNKSFAVAPYLGVSIDLEIGKWIQKSIPSVGNNFKK